MQRSVHCFTCGRGMLRVNIGILVPLDGRPDEGNFGDLFRCPTCHALVVADWGHPARSDDLEDGMWKGHLDYTGSIRQALTGGGR